jgi:hypothetical protein
MNQIRNTIFGEVGIENLLARLQNLQWFGHLKKWFKQGNQGY